MSSFGTVTTVERIDRIGPGETSPGLVFRALSRQCVRGIPLFPWGLALKTELHADDHGLTATGDFGGPRRGTLYLPWNRIQELHYAPGGNGEIGGLYAREGAWCSRCILPRLTEAQADEVVAVIADLYPAVALLSHIGPNRLPPASAPSQPSTSAWRPRWSTAIPPPR